MFEGGWDIVKDVGEEFSGLKPTPPDHALQGFQGCRFHIPIDQTDRTQNELTAAFRVVERYLTAGLSGELGCSYSDRKIIEMAVKKPCDVFLRVCKKHVIHKGNRRGCSLDIQQQPLAAKDDHEAAPLSPPRYAGPRQSGS